MNFGLFSPAVSDGVVYVGSNDTYLYAVDVQSGQEKWKFQAGGRVLRRHLVLRGHLRRGGLHQQR